jgi:hypothetical protein
MIVKKKSHIPQPNREENGHPSGVINARENLRFPGQIGREENRCPSGVINTREKNLTFLGRIGREENGHHFSVLRSQYLQVRILILSFSLLSL